MSLIKHPSSFSYITKKVALIIIGVGWGIGSAFAMIPMFWNNWETATMCEFNEILPLWYVAGVITPAFTLVWLCMLVLYWRIWREASKHAKQLRSSFSGLQDTPPSDWKSVQVSWFYRVGFFFLFFKHDDWNNEEWLKSLELQRVGKSWCKDWV